MRHGSTWREFFSLKLLKNQIILWFVGIIAILLGAVALFTVCILRPYLYDTHVSHLQKDVELLSWELSNQRTKWQSYSVSILADATIQDFLQGKLQDTSDISNRLRLLMMRYTEYDSSIQALYLVDGDGNLYGNNVTRAVEDLVTGTLPQAYASEGQALWLRAAPRNTVVMFRVIHDTKLDLTKKIGALYMLVDKRSLTDVCNRFLDPSLHYRLENAKGTLVLGDDALTPGSADRYFTCSTTADGWTLSAWIEKDAVYAPANSILSLVLYSFIGTLLFGVWLIVFISGRLTEPLREIRHAMKRVGEGDLTTNVHIQRTDEIGRLAKTFNEMIVSTGGFIHQIEEDQRRQRALELKTLQYQINPHFLYNTLDTIHMMALKTGHDDISELVLSLSSLFRLALAHGRDTVTLEHELKYITHYLQIQQIRFPSQFTYRIDVPENLLRCRVLKFLLQPLVENSLNHGLQGSAGDGEIHVTAHRERDELVLCVRDNGMGMTAQQLEDLAALINRTDIEDNQNPFAGGVGVRNVHQRLLLYYGRGLSIESDWEEGTSITIHIPLQQFPDDKEVSS